MQNEKRQSNSYENVGLIIQGDNNTVSGNMVSVNKNLLELDDIVKTIKQTLRDSDIEDESREIINDNVDVIHEQLKNNNPKKGFIKTAISGLQGIYPKIEDSVKLASSIMAIIKLAKDLEIL